MNPKPMNGNGIRLAQAATGISPADFPLCSLESRAAMRALLDQAERMRPARDRLNVTVRAVGTGEVVQRFSIDLE